MHHVDPSQYYVSPHKVLCIAGTSLNCLKKRNFISRQEHLVAELHRVVCYCLDNWFIISPKNDKFMKEWYTRFRIKIENGPLPLWYFTMHEISKDLLNEFSDHPIKQMNSCAGPLKHVSKSLLLPVTHGIEVNKRLKRLNHTNHTDDDHVVKLTRYCRLMSKIWPAVV